MNDLKKVISLCLSLLLYNCKSENSESTTVIENKQRAVSNHNKNDTVQTSNIKSADENIEDVIFDKISMLPEVKERQKYIENLTQHKSGLSMITQKTPTNEEPYYWIQVGYNNAERFENYFNFYVYKKNLEIKFFDTETDQILSLDEWRKQRNN